MVCKYKGTDYNDGAEECMAGGKFQCRGSSWTYIGQCLSDCSNGEVPFVPTMNVINYYINNCDAEKESFKKNPSDYIIDKLTLAGFAKESIDGLHAHYSDNGKLVPSESSADLQNRTGVFEFSGNGNITFNSPETVSPAGDCNGCQGICIVVRL